MSVPLAINLLKSHKTIIVGTIRKNKKLIPPILLNTKQREINSSKFGYGTNV